MIPKPYDFVAVWLTHGERGLPHDDALRTSNPGLQVGAWLSDDDGHDGWRNCDRNIRQWWQTFRHHNAEVKRVLFLEYDVKVNLDLRTVFPARRALPGCEGAALRTRNQDARSWLPFQEIENLPLVMQPHAVGISPLAVVMLSREALDAICGAEYNSVFQADIFSELRLPSVVKHAGFSVQGNAGLDGVTTGLNSDPGETRGIFHPVKP